MPAIDLSPTPDSVARARRWSIEVLGGLDAAELADTLALLVSELVSNVVLHARTACTLTIEDHADRLRVEVRDGSDRLPGLAARADPLAQSGRGMLLVDGLSDGHGVEPLPGGGKLIWFELRRPEAA